MFFFRWDLFPKLLVLGFEEAKLDTYRELDSMTCFFMVYWFIFYFPFYEKHLNIAPVPYIDILFSLDISIFFCFLYTFNFIKYPLFRVENINLNRLPTSTSSVNDAFFCMSTPCPILVFFLFIEIKQLS